MCNTCTFCWASAFMLLALHGAHFLRRLARGNRGNSGCVHVRWRRNPFGNNSRTVSIHVRPPTWQMGLDCREGRSNVASLITEQFFPGPLTFNALKLFYNHCTFSQEIYIEINNQATNWLFHTEFNTDQNPATHTQAHAHTHILFILFSHKTAIMSKSMYQFKPAATQMNHNKPQTNHN